MRKVLSFFKKKETKVDILVITSFITLVGTTLALNIYIGFYLLALILLLIAWVLAKS
ncbi:MAG: hypothetical protein Q8936_21220 [Bacillota bacterium]|nr:hypothetical protein [Bacillota bacterium]